MPGGTYGGQVSDGVLAKVHLIVGQVGPRAHPVVISPAPESIIEITGIYSN